MVKKHKAHSNKHHKVDSTKILIVGVAAIALIAIIAFIYVAGVGNEDIAGEAFKTKLNVAGSYCTDSDGLNYYSAGEVSFPSKTTIKFSNGDSYQPTKFRKNVGRAKWETRYAYKDVCQNGYLYEFGCVVENNKNYLTYDTVLCKCQNGKCIEPEVTPRCVDSDNGKNALVKGTVTYKSANILNGQWSVKEQSLNDKCAGGGRNKNYVTEYFCSSNPDEALKSQSIKCDNGYKCDNGECKPNCNNDCEPFGKRECLSSNQFKLCSNSDTSDPCYEWSQGNCNANEFCDPADGLCKCQVQSCAPGFCGDAIDDGCGGTMSCACDPGQVCQNSQCVASESDTEFCAKYNSACGLVTTKDNSGMERTVDCGSCPEVSSLGSETLEQRKQRLLDLIENDPDKALKEEELPSSIKAGFSPQQLQYVEKRGEISGELDVIYMEDLSNQSTSSKLLYYLNSDGNRYQLFSSQKLPVMESGTQVAVKGMALDNKMAVDFYPDKSLVRTLQKPLVKDMPGPQKVLVIAANIGNQETMTTQQIKELVFGPRFKYGTDFQLMSTKDLLKVRSYGQMSIEGDVVGPYQISVCQWMEVISYAMEEAVKNNIPVSSYNYVIVFSPGTPCIPKQIRGLASIGKVKIALSNGLQFNGGLVGAYTESDQDGSYLPSSVVAHELGHNFGVMHASEYGKLTGYFCGGEAIPYNPECKSMEYSDQLNIMGGVNYIDHYENDVDEQGQQYIYYGSRLDFSGIHKYLLGWLQPKNVITTTKGTYVLQPPIKVKMNPPYAALQPEGLILIRVPVNVAPLFYGTTSEVYYTLEFMDGDLEEGEHPNYRPNILIRIGKFGEDGKLTNTNFVARLISPPFEWFASNSYKDPVNNYEFILDSINKESATVTIRPIKQILAKADTEIQTNPNLNCKLYPTLPGCGAATSSAPLPTNAPKTSQQLNVRLSSKSVPYNWAFESPTLTVYIDAKNAGLESWTKDKGIKLKWAGSQANPWGTNNVFELDPTDIISPGQTKRFSFTITKPGRGSPSRLGSCGGGYDGTYNFEWQMYSENEPFGMVFKREICV